MVGEWFFLREFGLELIYYNDWRLNLNYSRLILGDFYLPANKSLVFSFFSLFIRRFSAEVFKFPQLKFHSLPEIESDLHCLCVFGWKSRG